MDAERMRLLHKLFDRDSQMEAARPVFNVVETNYRRNGYVVLATKKDKSGNCRYFLLTQVQYDVLRIEAAAPVTREQLAIIIGRSESTVTKIQSDLLTKTFGREFGMVEGLINGLVRMGVLKYVPRIDQKDWLKKVLDEHWYD